MFDKITISEVLQLLLNIRVGYPAFADMLNLDEMIELLAETGDSDVIEPYMYERLLWVFVRFSQLLYNFPIKAEQEAMTYGGKVGEGIN